MLQMEHIHLWIIYCSSPKKNPGADKEMESSLVIHSECRNEIQDDVKQKAKASKLKNCPCRSGTTRFLFLVGVVGTTTRGEGMNYHQMNGRWKQRQLQ